MGTDTKTAALVRLEDLAEAFAETEAALARSVQECEDDVARTRARHATEVRTRSEALADARAELIREVDANRALFEKPKSRVLAGVKLGLRKAQDDLDLGDEDKLVARIRSVCPEKADSLIQTKSNVVRKAVKALSKDLLQRLGVRYVAGADEPFAAVEKSDAEKQAEAILDAAEKGGAA